MPYTPEQIEYFHDNGMMPDWIYYQFNGNSAQENYARIKQEQRRRFKEMMLARHQKQEDQDEPFEIAISSEVKVK